jgi:anaerobic selenocysteine-containing dehydrogenase
MTAGPITTVRTMCPMSCHPTLCGMLADVRDGQLVGVRGDPDNYDSQGFLCIRGQASREVIGNSARLLHPLIRDRRTDAFRRATWDEALERIVASMRAAPPAASAVWPGHGTFTTNYGTRINAQLMARLMNFWGGQYWDPAMICWGLGAFGLALTGPIETSTKEDMGEHADLVVLWGANLASQPNTARHLIAAKKRGAHVVAIDVRHTEATAKADEVLLVRPGSDAALALALMHVICGEGLHDAAFVAAHTVGFDALREHVRAYTPAWGEAQTGVPAERIAALARRYATGPASMIVLGGSSMHKGANGWQASRAIACLPGLTGQIGRPGAGFGPRHGGLGHGRGSGNITAPERRGDRAAVIPNQMSAVIDALGAGRIRTLLLLGTNMLSSFADTNAVAAGLGRTGLVVSYDLFLNATAERCADIVLPATAWLEDVGCKASNTHLYLMERALQPPGETRSVYRVLTELAQRLGLAGYDAWGTEERVIDAVLDHPSTGRATVAALRAEGGMRRLDVPHVAHPTLAFATPSGKIEFLSAQAAHLGLPALPEPEGADIAGDAPLLLAQGRTLAHFHSFYNSGQALPTLARRATTPELWMSPADAEVRGVTDHAPIRIFNARGELHARALVTDKIPAGVVWMRDGWPGLNTLTAGGAVLPDAAVGLFAFSAGQSSFAAAVEVAAA